MYNQNDAEKYALEMFKRFLYFDIAEKTSDELCKQITGFGSFFDGLSPEEVEQFYTVMVQCLGKKLDIIIDKTSAIVLGKESNF